MRGYLKLAVLSALGALATPVYAAGGSIWDHNGSKLTFEENGDKRKLVYKELREGLDKAGIRQGTVLFNGATKPNGRLAGFAKIFKGTCNPIDYFVEGTINEARGEIVLQGQAPVYASGTTCEVNGYSDSSPASTLKFAKISDAPDSAVVAGQQPEAQIEQGDGGVTDDYLPPARPSRSQSAARAPQDEPPLASPPLRTDPQTEALQPRRGPDPATGAPEDRNRQAEVDEGSDREYWRPYGPRGGPDPYADPDRRYSRAPDPSEDPRDRRRPGAWEPEDAVVPEEDDEYYEPRDRRPLVGPFWSRPRPW